MMAQAKSTLVSLDGIGSELLPALVAWHEGEAIGYAIAQNPHLPQRQLHQSLAFAAALMVTGWQADGIALVMEGYAKPAHLFTEAYDREGLAAQYPTNPDVFEALWVAYADIDGGTCMGVMCFHQHVGRIVTYEDPEFSRDDQLDVFLEDDTLPNIVYTAVNHLKPLPPPPRLSIQQCRERMAVEIHQLGFSVYLEGSEPWIALSDQHERRDNRLGDDDGDDDEFWR